MMEPCGDHGQTEAGTQQSIQTADPHTLIPGRTMAGSADPKLPRPKMPTVPFPPQMLPDPRSLA